MNAYCRLEIHQFFENVEKLDHQISVWAWLNGRLAGWLSDGLAGGLAWAGLVLGGWSDCENRIQISSETLHIPLEFGTSKRIRFQ